MKKVLNKTDWGDYWTYNKKLDNKSLLERAFSLLAKIGISVGKVNLDVPLKNPSQPPTEQQEKNSTSDKNNHPS